MPVPYFSCEQGEIYKAVSNCSPWPLKDGHSRVVFMLGQGMDMYLSFEEALDALIAIE